MACPAHFQNHKHMLLNKSQLFIILLIIIITPFLAYKVNWLAHSERTNGTMSFAGKNITGQYVHQYSVIMFTIGKDSIWFNGADNVIYNEGETVPVRFQLSNPHDARINIFISIWGDTLVFGGIPVLILIVLFLHPQIIPRRSMIRVKTRKPFLEIA